MKKDKKNKDILKLCWKHEAQNKVQELYFYEQVCLQCLQEKVEILWSGLEKNLGMKWSED